MLFTKHTYSYEIPGEVEIRADGSILGTPSAHVIVEVPRNVMQTPEFADSLEAVLAEILEILQLPRNRQ
ncbi:hypothetical protein SDC9_57816 [bioreactor metagenome]|uniref:Uncharacterized protein n=1 Tax=bioreactor metagenome TaxID=1076179 RepID=A0A644X5N6_9ZZZZ